MRRSSKLGALLLGLGMTAGLVNVAPATAVMVPAPAWAPLAAAGPTNLPPGGKGTIAVYAQNVGGVTSEGTITLTDALPAGILTTGTPTAAATSPWVCSPGAGQSTIECTTIEEVPPGMTPVAIDIPVEVEAGAVTGQNVVTFNGGNAAASATFKGPITISTAPAKAGVAALTFGAYNADGTPTTQAASHPYASDVGVIVNTVRTVDGKAVVPAGDPRTIAVDLPPGFLGNPTATPRCTEGLRDKECPIDTQVGLAGAITTNFGNNANPSAVHSVKAPVGYPAKFTFGVAGDLYQANLLARLRSDEDYGVTVEAPNLAQINPVYGSFASVWGTPASPSHNEQRCEVVASAGEPGTGCGPGTAKETAFVTMASDCALQAAQPPFARASYDSWQDPGNFSEELFAVPAVTGCGALSLGGAGFSFNPEKVEGARPTSVTTELTLPQDGLIEPEALATPPLKEAVISFPPGVTLNAAAADGLKACSLNQIGFREFGPEPNRIRFNKEQAHCPDASKVGTLEVETALLDNPLHGALYLAAENENPFGSILAVYLVIEDPSVGIIIKLPGEVRPDPVTGQLRTFFDDLPPAAVGKATLKIVGGDRAPLATPDTCGEAKTTSLLTPWSAPESGPPTETKSSFVVSGGSCSASKAARPFTPSFNAGTLSAGADTFSPFEFKLTRKDGEQELKGLTFNLPSGLTGKLAGIATCSDAAIVTAAHKTGKAEQAVASCPASSQLGTVTSGAGIGNAPIYVSGKLYLAGPYKGAPLSTVAIIPAVAGPFDLGDVVVRAAVYLDPVTGRLSTITDPIPDVLQGIPVALRSVKVNLDRPDFILTPTSCDKFSIGAQVTGANGKSSSASAPFQVGGCENLAFKPKLKATLHGGTSRNAHPALTATFSNPPGAGYTNAAFAQVALPHSEFLDQGHINTVCTRPQFAAGACPSGSIYGYAEATTPLLDEPLAGPVYLRSSSNKLPDLVIALRGPPSRPLEIDLDGRIDSVHGGIRTTIESLPDAPVSNFTLKMKGGNKGLLVNSRDLCTAKRKARITVRLLGQNGKRADQFPALGNDCGNGGRK